MSSASIDFVLAPDASSARRIKRRMAQEVPGLHRMVGTWPELMAQAEAAYLLPPDPDNWSDNLTQAAFLQNDVFWASSLKVAPRETITELDAALFRLLEAEGPDAEWPTMMDKIPGETRLHRRLSDLWRLLGIVPGRPEPIQKMANLLANQDPPLRTLHVYYLRDANDLNIWQLAVLNKLENDAPAPDPRLQSLLESSLSAPETSNPALQAVRNLYSSDVVPPLKINGVRVIAVRDYLAEAEIAAGLIQKALENGSQACDIGLLLPEDAMSLMAMEDVFNRCGLPLSGLHRSTGQRDLGPETMREFMLCLRKPAPMMAVAALLTSPLMPWSMEEGHAMAKAVMAGDVMLRSTQVPAAGRKVMDLLNQGAITPAELQRLLNRFVAIFSTEAALHDHLLRAHDTAEQLQTALFAMADLDWEKLLYLAAPVSLSAVKPAGYWQEGIPVFHEGALPWCAVRHLFVLGFNDGHYPAGAGSSAVFTEAEWEQVADFGWPVLTNDLIRKRQRILFANQLAAATENLTLLYACRDAGGKTLESSSSLVFLARSLGVESDDLGLDLDRSEDVLRIPDLPLGKIAAPSALRELTVTDIDLKVDLLKVFNRKDGGLAPLSPSAADTVMVSPFAWLLRRLDCEPNEWATDDFDALKAGTLAHSVFEELFQAGRPLPTEEEISERLPKILQEQVLQIVPFLRSPDWRVERYKFESEVLKAAVHWKKLLASCKANIVAAEQWLRGQHGDVPLHGQSDLLVRLPSGKLLVVDYKKSSSGKRRDRMRSGFDLQAHLYRLMIQTGGLQGFESSLDDIGIVYYLLNDTTALADSPVDSDGTVPGWEVLTADISSRAMQHLDQRLAQIRKGIVKLNTAEDEEWWPKNAGLRVYALDDGPLLRLFMRSEEVPS